MRFDNAASHKAVVLAKAVRERALRDDCMSMCYEEVRGELNAAELDEIATGIRAAIWQRNEAEMLVLELLHVLASPDPHAELVIEKLKEETNVFERATEFLGVDMTISGTVGA